MVVSRHTASEDELEALAILQGTVLNSTFCNRSGLISLEQLTAEQLEIGAVLSIVYTGLVGISDSLINYTKR